VLPIVGIEGDLRQDGDLDVIEMEAERAFEPGEPRVVARRMHEGVSRYGPFPTLLSAEKLRPNAEELAEMCGHVGAADKTGLVVADAPPSRVSPSPSYRLTGSPLNLPGNYIPPMIARPFRFPKTCFASPGACLLEERQRFGDL
jgi:hypothetical protein